MSTLRNPLVGVPSSRSKMGSRRSVTVLRAVKGNETEDILNIYIVGATPSSAACSNVLMKGREGGEYRVRTF